MKIKLLIFLLCVIPIFFIYKITYVDKYDYLALGDGLSLGWTHYATIGYGYTDYVNDYLNTHKKLKTFNKSYSEKNKTVNELIIDIEKNKKTINSGKTIYIQQAITDAEVITISIGNNEISNILKFTQNSKESYVLLNKVINEITYLLDIIRKYNNEQIIFVGFYSYGKRYNDELVKYINTNLKQITKEYNVSYINTNKIFNNNIKYLPNTLENYPSNLGYKKIGEEVVKKIKL